MDFFKSDGFFKCRFWEGGYRRTADFFISHLPRRVSSARRAESSEGTEGEIKDMIVRKNAKQSNRGFIVGHTPAVSLQKLNAGAGKTLRIFSHRLTRIFLSFPWKRESSFLTKCLRLTTISTTEFTENAEIFKYKLLLLLEAAMRKHIVLRSSCKERSK